MGTHGLRVLHPVPVPRGRSTPTDWSHEHGQLRARQLEFNVARDLRLAYTATTASAAALFPDVLPALDALRHVPLCIISNGEETQQRGKLRATGILERFSIVVVSSEVGAAKPSAGIFAAACRRAGQGPSGCLHLGDSPTHDALAGAAAGLRGVWLARDPSVVPDPRVPTIRSLADLPPLVRAKLGEGDSSPAGK
jgi:HAD superfamily hydrolase (TIGR01509 family)